MILFVDPPESPGCWTLLPSGCPRWKNHEHLFPSEPAIWFEEKIVDPDDDDLCTKCTEMDCRLAEPLYDATCRINDTRVHFVEGN